MPTCEYCTAVMTPSKKGAKRFCGKECRSKAWYDQNKTTTIERAAQWRKDNPEKMTECRQSWKERNPSYHSEYTRSYRGDSENVRISKEIVKMAEKLSPEERIEVAHEILDMQMGMMTPCSVEEFLVQVLEGGYE